MIPEEVLKIFTGTMVSHVGTRDAKLQTTEAMGWGVKFNNDKKELTVFIPRSISQKTLANVNNNKKMAVTVGEPLNHTLYQFKGDFISHADATAADEKLMDDYMNTFYDNYLKLFGYPPEITSIFEYKPAVGITFGVEEIFVQTPGPKAGTNVYKKESAHGNR
jgi:hypothetical protein